MVKIQLFIAGISLLLFIITMGLIKKKILRAEYSIIWLIAEIALFLLGIFPRFLGVLSNVLGIYYLTVIFIIAFVFLLVIVFYYSIILSRLSDMNRALVQEVALLKAKNGKRE